jgi:hypothetical protein
MSFPLSFFFFNFDVNTTRSKTREDPLPSRIRLLSSSAD